MLLNRGRKLFLLSFFFVFLFQTFFYVKEIEFAYLLSKAVLPAVGLILSVLMFVKAVRAKGFYEPGVKTLFFAAFFFFFGCLAASVNYGQSLALTITSQAKVLPILTFFVTYYVLSKFRATPDDIASAFLWTGFSLAILYVFLSKTINVADVYTPESSIYVNDAKGYRIRYPSVLVVIAFFLCVHSLKIRYEIGKALILLFISYFLVFELKQRVELLSVLSVVILSFCSRRWVPYFYMFLAVSILVVILIVGSDPSLLIYLDDLSDDTSWLARERQLVYVFDTFSDKPWSIVFGVGKLSEISDYGYEEYLGFRFTTADLGWVGVTHEYGLLGVLVLVGLIKTLFSKLKEAEKLCSENSALVVLRSLRSYVLMSVFLSIIAPRFLYISGAFLSIYACAAYLAVYCRKVRN